MNNRKSILKVVCILFLCIILSAGEVGAEASLTQLPYSVSSSNQAGWWSPLEVYNDWAYMVFNAPGNTSATHKIEIAKKDSSGNWTHLYCKNSDGTITEYSNDIGHNAPSIARDGSGYLHVFGSMHNDPWNYYRSNTPGTDPINHSEDLPDQGAAITYPIVKTAPNGDIYMIARVNDDNNNSKDGKLYRWNNSTRTWSSIATFARETYRSVYTDDIQIDTNGDVHILYEWAKHPASAFRHKLSYLKYMSSTGNWYNSAGVQVTIPVSPDTSDVIQDFVTDEFWSNWTGDDTYTAPAIQGAKMSVDGGVKVVYRHRDTAAGTFKIKSAYPSSGVWNRETVYSAGETKATIDITYTGTEKRIYYCTTSGTDRAYVAYRTATSTYIHQSMAPGKLIDRLSVVRSFTTDKLYLMDATNRRLYYGTR